jgi:hypothetical protein
MKVSDTSQHVVEVLTDTTNRDDFTLVRCNGMSPIINDHEMYAPPMPSAPLEFSAEYHDFNACMFHK